MAGTIKLLNAEIDHEDESYFRLLLPDKTVRYLTIAPHLFDNDDMAFAPRLFELLPQLPSDDWNTADVVAGIDGKPTFEKVAKTELQGVNNTWCPRDVDHLELTTTHQYRSNVHEVTSEHIAGTAVAKFARFDWEIGYIEKETAVHKMLDGKGLTPGFLAHLSEEGRVIGFVVEKVPDARHALPADYDICRQALQRFHDLGFLHNDINKHNYLVSGGKATLIDIETVTECHDPIKFEEEMNKLKAALADESGRGA